MESTKIKRIRVYSTMTCPYCRMEKDFLESRKVEFDYVLVDQDRQAALEMVQKTGQMGVPVTEIQYDDSEEYIVGFDRERLSEILNLK